MARLPQTRAALDLGSGPVNLAIGGDLRGHAVPAGNLGAHAEFCKAGKARFFDLVEL